ncbi:leucyl/phenylalanyl-tRNA--protein transferase [Neisseria arctica]|uniref:Leucyl/phenylalanyl-tRNA--protein transferase n=1 Tax=Neisseria arctica TaxID=1470200 RepID=A0A0J1C1F9_9NEIS|nr:leucyl/phenylalanyl-tRNA--protein transferase [Neisseria arctica]KLT72128.1 leucyl/phenylalanyl-tRNA--protein transferase [Neisseria arctica]UOO86850.1 leucyl/phenylalanyl-tRNA--protein transferase [Neisseria arctica]
MDIPVLDPGIPFFPDAAEAVARREGLVAVGGSLRPEWLLTAYPQGIFPWFSEGEPICWWALAPRTVLYPDKLHIGRSLAKTLRNKPYAVTVNRAFAEVVAACAAASRPGQNGTWITRRMRQAYEELHRIGHAHSFECWYPDGEGCLKLAGGLYGVQIGSVFFGESMFAAVSDASKIAFARAVPYLAQCGVKMIDCQMDTEHLARFGSENVGFEYFQTALQQLTVQPLQRPLLTETIFSNIG